MDPLLIIAELVNAAATIRDRVKTVKANQAQFQRLSERIQTLLS